MLVLQLGYTATQDLVQQVLRTCGPPRTQREALPLLLASVVNTDEPVDAGGFHTHDMANSDVEWVFGYLWGLFAATLMAAAAQEDLVAVAWLRSGQRTGGQHPQLDPLAVAPASSTSSSCVADPAQTVYQSVLVHASVSLFHGWLVFVFWLNLLATFTSVQDPAHPSFFLSALVL
ncbi:hypothetical protein HK405_006004, partial [Cladochytrium tenue]